MFVFQHLLSKQRCQPFVQGILMQVKWIVFPTTVRTPNNRCVLFFCISFWWFWYLGMWHDGRIAPIILHPLKKKIPVVQNTRCQCQGSLYFWRFQLFACLLAVTTVQLGSEKNCSFWLELPCYLFPFCLWFVLLWILSFCFLKPKRENVCVVIYQWKNPIHQLKHATAQSPNDFSSRFRCF